MSNWDVGLREETSSYARAKYEKMTAVQTTALPHITSDKNVVVEACTGSGKTMCYALPAVDVALDIIKDSQVKSTDLRSVCSLILLPTRELAFQVAEVLQDIVSSISKDINNLLEQESNKLESSVSVACITAGVSDLEIASRLWKGNETVILTATPQRLTAILEILNANDARSTYSIAGLPSSLTPRLCIKRAKLVVLDEADRLLSGVSLWDIKSLMKMISGTPKYVVLSATIATKKQSLTALKLGKPVFVRVLNKHFNTEDASEEGSFMRVGLPATLKHYCITVPGSSKFALLARFIDKVKQSNGKVIVFFLTCASVELYHHLMLYNVEPRSSESSGYRSKNGLWGCNSIPETINSGDSLFKLHGKMSIEARNQVSLRFRDSSSAVLFCTDVAARGLEFPNVDWVVQFDCPRDRNFYFHRAGRTARAGAVGGSLLFLLPSESPYRALLKRMHVPLLAWKGEVDCTATPAIMEFPGEAELSKVREEHKIMCQAEMEGLHNRSESIRENKQQSNEPDPEHDLRAEKIYKVAQNWAKRLELEIDNAFSRPNTLACSYAFTLDALELAYMLKLGPVANDRSLLLKTSSCLIAYIEAYSKYDFPALFDLEKIDLLDVAEGMMLLHLPRLKELAKSERLHGPLAFNRADVDIKSIAFIDPTAEAKRQKEVPKLLEKIAEKRKMWAEGRRTVLRESEKRRKEAIGKVKSYAKRVALNNISQIDNEVVRKAEINKRQRADREKVSQAVAEAVKIRSERLNKYSGKGKSYKGNKKDTFNDKKSSKNIVTVSGNSRGFKKSSDGFRDKKKSSGINKKAIKMAKA